MGGSRNFFEILGGSWNSPWNFGWVLKIFQNFENLSRPPWTIIYVRSLIFKIFQAFVPSIDVKVLTSPQSWATKSCFLPKWEKNWGHPGCNWAGARAPRNGVSSDNQLRASRLKCVEAASFDQVPLLKWKILMILYFSFSWDFFFLFSYNRKWSHWSFGIFWV